MVILKPYPVIVTKQDSLSSSLANAGGKEILHQRETLFIYRCEKPAQIFYFFEILILIL